MSLTHHRVRVGETDMMGVVHHGQYVGFLETGRIEYMRRRGFPYQDIVGLGLHMPVIGLNLTYKKPARFDDLLALETRLSLLGRVRVSFAYRIWKTGPQKPSLLVEANVDLACVDAAPRPRPLPEAVVAALLRPEAPSPGGFARDPSVSGAAETGRSAPLEDSQAIGVGSGQNNGARGWAPA